MKIEPVSDDSDFDVNEAAPQNDAAIVDVDSDFEDPGEEIVAELAISQIRNPASRVTVNGQVVAIIPPANVNFKVITVVLAESGSEQLIQVDLWSAWKAKIVQMGLRVGHTVAFETVDIIHIEAKKLPFNKGSLGLEVKMRPSSKIRITGEFTPAYGKVSNLSVTSEYKMLNVKGIPIQFEDAITLAGGSIKKTMIFGQDRLSSMIGIAFWNRLIAICDSIELKKPTFIENVQVKKFNGEFYLDWNEFTSFRQI